MARIGSWLAGCSAPAPGWCSWPWGGRALPLLALGLMAVDLGVQGSFVANQARIYAIDPAARSRMSGQLFLTAYLCAAACSAVIAAAWSRWGWPGTCGFALALVIERRPGGTLGQRLFLMPWANHPGPPA